MNKQANTMNMIFNKLFELRFLLNMKKILFILIALFCSLYSYSQIDLKGKYKIITVGHYAGEDVQYEDTLTCGNNIALFKNNLLLLSLNGYIVDSFHYTDSIPFEKLENAKSYYLESLFDNRKKQILIDILDSKPTYELWLERGNGGFDIFSFIKE